MASILYKWLFVVFASLVIYPGKHPVYMSVTEIDHNAKDKTLEISCKIFTDDFEKTLRAAYHSHVDLLNPADSSSMNTLVSDYIQRHLRIIANGKTQILHYKGYEQIEEGIYSYFELDNIPILKKITVTDNILYDYQAQQISILHITVNGVRKSRELVNPEERVSLDF